MEFANFIQEKIKDYKIISIIGLAKNVSKTTTLNHIIQILKGKYILGLTSIGRDGEKYDAITTLPKPRIFVESGVLIATAAHSIKKSEAKIEILKTTGINTPMGEIAIARVISNGYIELAGPSINSELIRVCKELLSFGSNLILVDGAFDRRSFASPLVSEVTILSTGASVSKNMQEVIDITHHTMNLLSVENEENSKIINLAKDIISKAKVGIINEDYSVKMLELLTALDSVDEILNLMTNKSKILVINGAITDKFLEEFMKKSDLYRSIKILVPDATKLFLNKTTFEKYCKKGGVIKILNKIKIILVTINPTSPLGYEFDKVKFLNELKKGTTIPIYDLGPSEY
ncbi:MAG: hypothetical protein ACTSV5_14315 [Promethearchaeota archaeon]